MDTALRPLEWITGPTSRAVLALLVFAALISSAGAAVGAGAPTISIVLVSPAVETVVPRYGASPLFRWRIDAGSTQLHGRGMLEVSTNATFWQAAVMRFTCGYSPGDCVARYQWKNRLPFWYDLANSCSNVPPLGNCRKLSRLLYWRVRFELSGGKSYSSPVGILRRSLSSDTQPPTAKAETGSSTYGKLGHVYYYVSDNSGLTRDVVELYDGTQVVAGARTEWNSGRGRYEIALGLPVPKSVRPGSYRWCLTVLDQADNTASDCAGYTITRVGVPTRIAVASK